MELMTKTIAAQLPQLGSTEGIPFADKLAVCKFFTPDSNWTWYAVEFDGEDLLFGYVIGLDAEWGYFSLRELQSVRGPLGLLVERDLQFKPQQIGTFLQNMWND